MVLGTSSHEKRCRKRQTQWWNHGFLNGGWGEIARMARRHRRTLEAAKLMAPHQTRGGTPAAPKALRRSLACSHTVCRPALSDHTCSFGAHWARNLWPPGHRQDAQGARSRPKGAQSKGCHRENVLA